MSVWREHWNRLWFVPGTALDLAAARVILSLHALWLLLYHLAPLETWIWTSEPYERGLTVSVLGLVVLSAAPRGDALRWDRRAPKSSVTRDAGDYGWALRLVQLFLAQV